MPTRARRRSRTPSGAAPFSYTVGLSAFDHPEVVVTGMPFEAAKAFLNWWTMESALAPATHPVREIPASRTTATCHSSPWTTRRVCTRSSRSTARFEPCSWFDPTLLVRIRGKPDSVTPPTCNRCPVRSRRHGLSQPTSSAPAAHILPTHGATSTSSHDPSVDEVSNHQLLTPTAAQPPHPTEDREVAGSTPVGATTRAPAMCGGFVVREGEIAANPQ